MTTDTETRKRHLAPVVRQPGIAGLYNRIPSVVRGLIERLALLILACVMFALIGFFAIEVFIVVLTPFLVAFWVGLMGQ